jgi:hypothetical protein
MHIAAMQMQAALNQGIASRAPQLAQGILVNALANCFFQKPIVFSPHFWQG